MQKGTVKGPNEAKEDAEGDKDNGNEGSEVKKSRALMNNLVSFLS